MLEDLKIKCHISHPTNEVVGRTLRGKPIYRYGNFMLMENGREIEDTEWFRRAKEEIHRCGKDDLLEQIKKYCAENCAWLKKDEKKVEEYALECLVSGAYTHWKNFTL